MARQIFKKATIAVAAALLALLFAALPAQAAEVLYEGTWGTCPWEITDDGVLTVHPGEGEQSFYEFDYIYYYCPWSDYSADITSIVF